MSILSQLPGRHSDKSNHCTWWFSCCKRAQLEKRCALFLFLSGRAESTGNLEHQGIFIFWGRLKLTLWFMVKVLFGKHDVAAAPPPQCWLRSLLKEDKPIFIPILSACHCPFFTSPSQAPLFRLNLRAFLEYFLSPLWLPRPFPSPVTQS